MHVHAFNRFLYKKYIVSQYSKKHQQDISNQKKKEKDNAQFQSFYFTYSHIF